MLASPRQTTSAIIKDSLRAADCYPLVLIALPVFLLLIESAWIYTPLQVIDSWVNLGYFLNFVDFKSKLFAGTYYGSRLSWILPGYIANTLFSPLVARYVLHLGFYYIAVLSLYWTLKRTVGREAALLGSVLLGSCRFFLSAIGWDYVDGAGITYYLLAVACLTRAAKVSKPAWGLVSAGAAIAAMVYANLFLIVFTPPLLFYYLFLGEHLSHRPITGAVLRFLAFLLLGAGLVTCALGAVNYAVAESFWFYGPSVAFVLHNIGGPNPWHSQTHEWVKSAMWLVLPAASFAAALVALFRSALMRPSNGSRAASFFLWNFVAIALLMLFGQIQGTNLLELSYYASYLLPSTFLFIGSLLIRTGAKSESRSFWLGVLGPPVAFGLAFAKLGDHSTWLVQYSVPVSLAVVCAGLVLRVLFPDSWRTLALCVAGLAFGYYVMDLVPFAQDRAGVQDRPGAYMRVISAMRAVRSTAQGRVRFWYDADERNSGEFIAINSIYLYEYSILSRRFPSLLESPSLAPGALVVVLTNRPDAVEAANAALAAKGLAAIVLGRTHIGESAVQYTLTSLEIADLPGRVLPYSAVFSPPAQAGQLAPCDTGPDACDLPASRWALSVYPNPRGRMDPEGDGLHVTTEPSRFAYSMMYAPLIAPKDGEYRFTLRYRLLSGHIDFGALSGDKSRWLAQAGVDQVKQSYRIRSFSLPLKAGEQIWLLLANNHPAGDRASSYVVEGLSAFRIRELQQ